jgi:hypothetical protein
MVARENVEEQKGFLTINQRKRLERWFEKRNEKRNKQKYPNVLPPYIR